eukprot:SAG11_NODE_37263_length_257_cov_2.715190_1_plen_30_part_10
MGLSLVVQLGPVLERVPGQVPRRHVIALNA